MSYRKLKNRIKKNEGYSDKPYKDQLGLYTIGYGHLIRHNENKYFKNNYNKKYLEDVFEKDFKYAHNQYKKIFYKKKHTSYEKELLIEMIFQLGTRGVLKFRRMLFFLNKKEKFMTSLEMLDSLWYLQTPERVKNLIKHYLDI